MNRAKEIIAPPVKVDRDGKLVCGSTKAFRWKLDVPASVTGTRRRRLYFLSEADAKSKKRDLVEQYLSASEAQRKKLSLKGWSISDAIEYTMRHAPLNQEIGMDDLLRRFLENRKSEIKIGSRYSATLRSYCLTIGRSLGNRQVSTLTRDAVRGFLNGLKGRDGVSEASVSTRNHYLETLRAIFSFAKAEGIITHLPTEGISSSRVDPDPITTLSVEESSRLLVCLRSPEHAEVAPAALLQLFAGLRRCEIPLLEWSQIGPQYVRLDRVKRGTKMRAVEMPEVMRSWIAPFRRSGGYVFDPRAAEAAESVPLSLARTGDTDLRLLEDAYAWRLGRLAAAARVELPKNVLRHTAITMRVNSTHDVKETSRWAGNTPEIVTSHYLGAGTAEDAREFYGLTPERVGKADGGVAVFADSESPATQSEAVA